ncbi:hypothetical protein NX779_02440 [Mycoplasma cottewii]|uniref:Rad50/SbcC-type AAA domain-containing protein n=1 Tax=Mycoplasma cottewii TaxID=51364 RepID=A0ABY5TVI1_9MOLU|nr:hypothetical protein [Mycoplasma cottewii]UWD34652.1 hypothetical protein NX779_02440 [Mycoplasma cottewii]
MEKKFYIKQVEIYDVEKKQAFWTKFEKGINIITSNQNSVGKSSLIKSIYYAFGADLNFDNQWNKETKLTSVIFTINDRTYKINRLRNSFLVTDNENGSVLYKGTQNITKLSTFLSSIFDFEIFLNSKEDKKLVLAPPAFFFLPYYIDQEKGWNNDLYNNFERLAQFNKKDRMESLFCHLGIYNKEIINNKIEIEDLETDLKNIWQLKEKYETTIGILEEENNSEVLSEKELKEEIQEIEQDVSKKLQQINENQDKLSELHKKNSILKNTLNILERKVDNSEYITLQCPNCNHYKLMFYDEYYRSIIEYNYSLNIAETSMPQIQSMIDQTQQEIKKCKEDYKELYLSLNEKKIEIEKKTEFHDFLQTILFDKINKTLDLKINDIKNQQIEPLDNKIKELKKQLNKTLKSKKELINEKYDEIAKKWFDKLEIDNEEIFEVAIKIDKPYFLQGFQTVKMTLAYYFTLHELINTSKEIIKFPFIVDSPRSKEASDSESERILSLISENKIHNQTIISTVDYDKYTNNKDNINRIFLDKKGKLLSNEQYNELDGDKIVEMFSDSNKWIDEEITKES